MEFPFAYHNGNYCCKTNEERVGGSKNRPDQVKDGTCDGIGFGRDSVCCKDDAHQKCPHQSGCYDNGKGPELATFYFVIQQPASELLLPILTSNDHSAATKQRLHSSYSAQLMRS